MQKKPPLKREDSFLKRFSTRQMAATQVSTVNFCDSLYSNLEKLNFA